MPVCHIKQRTLFSALLDIGVFYFAFMILDRLLSVIYGFNFQPYGPAIPFGFTIWGHLFNGTLAATGTYVTLRLYDHGKQKQKPTAQIPALIIAFTAGAVIPYMNDSEHLTKNHQARTIPTYVVVNDLYLFMTGLLVYRIAGTNKQKTILLVTAPALFLVIHFMLYMPRFPEFYWS